jgi:hypothetical protein
MRGFISYTHGDYRTYQEFRTHLRAVERIFNIDFWADDSVAAGEHWSAEIQSQIQASDVFILLVTPEFLASDYIFDKEIPAIMQRSRSTGGLVIPVVVRRCYWAIVSGATQPAPVDKGRLKPLAEWRPRSDGYATACEQIAAAIQLHYDLRPKVLGRPQK